jgi:deoxyribodipyrimidine photo-lyase
MFTTYRKTVEPIREYPRLALPTPQKASLPGYPPLAEITPQFKPFAIPNTFQGLLNALIKPLNAQDLVPEPLPYPADTKSAYLFPSGKTNALKRLDYIISSF